MTHIHTEKHQRTALEYAARVMILTLCISTVSVLLAGLSFYIWTLYSLCAIGAAIPSAIFFWNRLQRKGETRFRGMTAGIWTGFTTAYFAAVLIAIFSSYLSIGTEYDLTNNLTAHLSYAFFWFPLSMITTGGAIGAVLFGAAGFVLASNVAQESDQENGRNDILLSIPYRPFLSVLLYGIGGIWMLAGILLLTSTGDVRYCIVILLAAVGLYSGRFFDKTPILTANAEGIRRKPDIFLKERFYPWSGMRYTWYGMKLGKRAPLYRTAIDAENWQALRELYDHFGDVTGSDDLVDTRVPATS